MPHREQHRTQRIGWLRASVLGANDGLVSTASLIVGVAAADTSHSNILVAGVAGLVAGAMSMAAGEYVSVSSQADLEAADANREREELANYPEAELSELTAIYVERGLDEPLASQVASKLTEKGALAAHLRDELGISEALAARPMQAAFASALTFALGAAMPILIAWLIPARYVVPMVTGTTLLMLGVLGGLSAYAGGAPLTRGILRVVLWGAVALAVTAGVGSIFGVAA